MPDANTSLEESRATFVANLREAAPSAAESGVTLLVEPLNARDNPGYPLNRQADAHALVAEVAAANVKVQFDLYHCQIVEGDVAPKLVHWVGGPHSNVGHIQIAGPPDRLEPDAGELNYAWLLPLIDELGYEGWVGCEYRPAAGTEAGPRLGAPVGDRAASRGRGGRIEAIGAPWEANRGRGDPHRAAPVEGDQGPDAATASGDRRVSGAFREKAAWPYD